MDLVGDWCVALSAVRCDGTGFEKFAWHIAPDKQSVQPTVMSHCSSANGLCEAQPAALLQHGLEDSQCRQPTSVDEWVVEAAHMMLDSLLDGKLPSIALQPGNNAPAVPLSQPSQHETATSVTQDRPTDSQSVPAMHVATQRNPHPNLTLSLHNSKITDRLCRAAVLLDAVQVRYCFIVTLYFTAFPAPISSMCRPRLVHAVCTCSCTTT